MDIDDRAPYPASATDNLVRQIFSEAKFIQWLEVELVGFGPGWCEARMVIREHLHQQHGIVHATVQQEGRTERVLVAKMSSTLAVIPRRTPMG